MFQKTVSSKGNQSLRLKYLNKIICVTSVDNDILAGLLKYKYNLAVIFIF